MSHKSLSHESHVDPSWNAKKRSTSEIVRKVWVYLRPYPLMAFGTIACALLSLLFSFVYPKLTQYVIDQVILAGKREMLLPVIGALFGAFLLRDVFNSLRIRINNTLEQNVIYDMRREIYARLQRLPLNFFDHRASGDLMTRVVEDVNSVERLLIDGTEQGTVAVLGVLGVMAILLITNPFLAVIALAPIPLLLLGALCYTRTAHHRYRLQRRAASALNTLLMDNLQGIRQIKAFASEPHEDLRFAARAADLRAGSLAIMRVWALYSPAMSLAASLGMVLVLWAGGGLVLAQQMTIGQLIGFLFYLTLFYEPIARLHGLNQMLQAARAGAERVFDILDTTPERPDPARQRVLKNPVRGEIVYDRVAFSYVDTKVVLHDISFRARPGQVVALVGPTGAGKSTVVNLLAAFYEPIAGRITIDGQDIAAISLPDLRGQISIVSQEAFLFNGTVRENILYGRLSASEPELFEASRSANCHEFISRLPRGYDSLVGERGVRLSVGEKQRISIARALLKNAPVLILDEATASVDTVTEKQIQEALQRLMIDRTSLVIAHRLSTIRGAHQILVLQQGRIVESGTHDELIQQEGLYARLAQIQNTTFIEESFAKLSLA